MIKHKEEKDGGVKGGKDSILKTHIHTKSKRLKLKMITNEKKNTLDNAIDVGNKKLRCV